MNHHVCHTFLLYTVLLRSAFGLEIFFVVVCDFGKLGVLEGSTNVDVDGAYFCRVDARKTPLVLCACFSTPVRFSEYGFPPQSSI